MSTRREGAAHTAGPYLEGPWHHPPPPQRHRPLTRRRRRDVRRRIGAIATPRAHAAPPRSSPPPWPPLCSRGGRLLAGLWHQRAPRPVRDLTAALVPVLRPTRPTNGEGVPPAPRPSDRVTIIYPPQFDENDTKAREKVRDICRDNGSLLVTATCIRHGAVSSASRPGGRCRRHRGRRHRDTGDTDGDTAERPAPRQGDSVVHSIRARQRR